jgi:hypothetical protein
MKHPTPLLTMATVLALAVGAESVAAQAPAHATGAETGPSWSWEAAAGPVLLSPALSTDAVMGVELYAARYWGSGPVRAGVELAATRVLGHDGGRVAVGVVERRPAAGRLDFAAHLGAGALWHRDEVAYPGFGSAPCHPDLGCPPGGGSEPESDTIVIPAVYGGAALGLAVTARVLLRGGGRVTLARGEDGLVALFEVPVAVVVRF